MTPFLGLAFILAAILLAAKLGGYITIAHGAEMVDKGVAATQEITGDLNLPNTGILVALPVALAYVLDWKPG
jgi:hypothetical protein